VLVRGDSCCSSLSAFLPRCMEYRRGLAMRIVSVCPSVRPSVCLSHACIVRKRWKDLSRFLPSSMECRRGLAMRILSVRQSVCPSVTRVNCDKTIKRLVNIFIPHERPFSLVFWEEEWLVGGATPSTCNFGLTGPRWSKIADFEPIFARSASAVPSEKVQLILIRSPLRAFQCA